jgi:hypothetical protein
MSKDPRSAQSAKLNDEEHYVVSLEAYDAMANTVDALIGLSQLVSGGTIANAGGPEVSRAELGAIFRLFGQQLDGHLQALPHRHKIDCLLDDLGSPS